MYEVLSVDEIKRWIVNCNLSMNAIAHHLDLPINTMKWMLHKPETVAISAMRQRLFSRFIAQVDSGEIKMAYRGRVPYFVRVKDEERVPLRRYGVSFAGGTARLTALGAPRPIPRMPAFKGLLLTPSRNKA